jgi:hypothetical protein
MKLRFLTTRNNQITLASFMKLNISTNMEIGKKNNFEMEKGNVVKVSTFCFVF